MKGNMGVVVIYTPVTIGGGCHTGSINIGQYDEAVSGYRGVQRIHFQSMGILGGGFDPAEAQLTGGTYGILEVGCSNGRQGLTIEATKPLRGGMTFLPSQILYDKPLAIFSIAAGEVVNVGSIGPIDTSGPQWSWQGSYGTSNTAIIGPMPENVVANFRKSHPALASAMVTRLMIPQ